MPESSAISNMSTERVQCVIPYLIKRYKASGDKLYLTLAHYLTNQLQGGAVNAGS